MEFPGPHGNFICSLYTLLLIETILYLNLLTFICSRNAKDFIFPSLTIRSTALSQRLRVSFYITGARDDMNDIIKSYGRNAAATTSPPDSAHFPHKICFMCLPYELQRMVYIHSIKDGLQRHPRRLVQAIYYEKLKDLTWADNPSPLLFLNKQIQSEASDILKRRPVTMRVTGQNIRFYGLGLSVCISQDIHMDLSKITYLIVVIYPPHPDRPIEMLYIWNYMRKFRDTLSQFPKIQKLSLQFQDTIFKWTENGHLRKLLPLGGYDDIWLPSGLEHYPSPPKSSDLQIILDLFAIITNVEDVTISLPQSFPDEDRKFRCYADYIVDIMKGLVPPAIKPTSLENLDYERLEKDFKHDTAEVTMSKFLRKTQYGKQKMSERRYDNMMRRWPYFETLVRWGDRKFEGRAHYVDVDSDVVAGAKYATR